MVKLDLMDVLGELERGREYYRQRAWLDAYRSLSLADQKAPLAVEDRERLALAAYLTGRDDDYLTALDRAHHDYLDAGKAVHAARCAFWLALRHFLRGEPGRAGGWLARAERLLDGLQDDCVERGYLLLPAAEQQLGAGHCQAAQDKAARAVAIGERFGDADLVACARHVQGRALLEQSQIADGLALLDEAMVAVTAGELSPLVTGLIYCSVIEACQRSYLLGRAREWTSALARWCEEQPQMVAFTGTCLVHRAEILQLHGAWREAIEEARRACERFSQGVDPQPPAAAFYQQGEVHRLRGEFAAAEEAYHSASRLGWEPQPGVALMRLAQGRAEAAAAAIRRVVSATADRLERARFLPAQVEIMLAVGEIGDAAGACRELEEIAQSFGLSVLGAIAAQARGAVLLAAGDAPGALRSLRSAWQVWQEVEAPYNAARVRVLMGLACRALGDHDGARLELDTARSVFERLGATPDLARVDALIHGAPAASPLTKRELQVLRLVAAGNTNKAIAAELGLSVKTIDRHVSNIFTKLDVPSRAAAIAYSYEHELISPGVGEIPQGRSPQLGNSPEAEPRSPVVACSRPRTRERAMIEAQVQMSAQERTRDAWNRIAPGYDQFVTPTHMWLANEGLRRAGLRPGMAFLDVAAGSGALSIPAARLGAQVLATDMSPAMLEQLRRRAGREGLSNVETRVMDGHALELDDGTFDVAGSQFGVMLFPDMPRGLRELARVVRRGGRVLIVAYGPPAKIEFFQFFVRAVQAAIPGFTGPPMEPAPLPFQLQDPERLRRELAKAGLEDVRVETITESLEFQSGRQLWDWLINSNPIVGTVLAELNLTEEQRGVVRQALEPMVRDRAGGSGPAILTNPVHIGVGTR